MGELFIMTWVFFGTGSRNWLKEWISDLGGNCVMDWFGRVESAMAGAAGAVTRFVDGIHQADEMMIRSFGEKIWISGVRRGDGKICLNVLEGDSALEFKSSVKRAEKDLGPIIRLDTDGHESWPLATKWLNIIHKAVNRSEEGFVSDEGIHSNGVENQWSLDRSWFEGARGYTKIECLKRASRARQVFHNQVRTSPVPVWSLLKILVNGKNSAIFYLLSIPRFCREHHSSIDELFYLRG